MTIRSPRIFSQAHKPPVFPTTVIITLSNHLNSFCLLDVLFSAVAGSEPTCYSCTAGDCSFNSIYFNGFFNISGIQFPIATTSTGKGITGFGWIWFFLALHSEEVTESILFVISLNIYERFETDNGTTPFKDLAITNEYVFRLLQDSIH